MRKIDMHIHTCMSDGEFNIFEILNLAKSNNCSLLAITDHEYIEDYHYLSTPELRIYNGIEFNTAIKGLHILGYEFQNITEIQKIMKKLHNDNETVTYELITLLAKDGYDISVEQVKQFLKEKHIECNYLDKRHVVKYLINRKYSNSVYETYSKIIGRGTKYYLPLKKMSEKEILRIINDCGGYAAIAHPFTLNFSYNELYCMLKELKKYGLSGIEVINGNDKDNNVFKYKQLANELKLYETFGSDFHSLQSHPIGIGCEDSSYQKILKIGR